MRPDDAGMYYALGQQLLDADRAGDAIAEFARAARLRPDIADFGYAHAQALHHTGRAQEAIRVLRILSARHPDRPDIRTTLDAYVREMQSQ